MLCKKLMALTACALVLVGCGGVNLYAQPAADFERAVDITAQLTKDYTGLERRLLKNAQTLSVSSNPQVKLNFKPTQCAISDPGQGCAIVVRATGKPVVDGLALANSSAVKSRDGLEPLSAMVGKLQRYAGLLSSIAQASTKAQLQTVNGRTSSTYDELYASLSDMNRTELKAEARDFKGAAVDALASMYVESERVKLLLSLVEQGEPIVTAVSDTLGSFVGDIQNDYVLNQKDRVMQLVLTYNVMGNGDQAATTAAGLSQQVLRQTTLKRALSEQFALQAVMSIDAKGAFAHMKAAHTALLTALQHADSTQGKAEVAMAQMMTAVGGFTAAAIKASNTMNAMKGLM